MPSDIIGTQVLTEAEGHREFQFKPGPIFAHMVLGDEINRATPKTQSAVLEAMEERQVTVFGTTYLLEPPFFVLATQNPIELEGTYPLPEAQMDRFMFKVVMGSPKPDELREILNRTTGTAQNKIQPMFEPARAPEAIERSEGAGARGDGRRAGRALHHLRLSAHALPAGPGRFRKSRSTCASVPVRAARRR